MTTTSIATGKPELFSRTDKQLALTNAIDLMASCSFGTCLASKGSTDFKTATAYAGFAIRGLNFLWKQHLIGKLPLAQKHSLVKKAVSPLGCAAAQGLALAMASLQEENTALIGWGFCQVPSIASAAAVAHHSFQQLGRSIRELPTRPTEALQAMSIHLLNLTAETGRAIVDWQNTKGTEGWEKWNQFFKDEKMGAARFVHAFSNPGRKIAADTAKSQASFDAYLQKLSAASQAAGAFPYTGSTGDLLDRGDAFREQADLLAQTLPDLTWQKAGKANAGFVAYKKEAWHKPWDFWIANQEKKSQQFLDAFSAATADQLTPIEDFSKLFQIWTNRKETLQQSCDETMQSLNKEAGDLLKKAGHLDDYPAQALEQSRLRITEACRKIQDASDESVFQKASKRVDTIEDQIVDKDYDLYRRVSSRFAKPSTSAGKFPALLKLGQSGIRKISADAEPFKKALDAMPRAEQNKDMRQRVEARIQQSIQAIKNAGGEFESKLEQAMKQAQLNRQDTRSVWQKMRSADVFDVPEEAVTTVNFRDKWKEPIDEATYFLLDEIQQLLPEEPTFSDSQFLLFPDLLNRYQSNIREFSKEVPDYFKEIRGKMKQDWERAIVDKVVKTVQKSCEEAEYKVYWAHDKACFALPLLDSDPQVVEKAKYILSWLEPFDETAYASVPDAYVNRLASALLVFVDDKEAETVRKAARILTPKFYFSSARGKE